MISEDGQGPLGHLGRAGSIADIAERRLECCWEVGGQGGDAAVEEVGIEAEDRSGLRPLLGSDPAEDPFAADGQGNGAFDGLGVVGQSRCEVVERSDPAAAIGPRIREMFLA